MGRRPNHGVNFANPLHQQTPFACSENQWLNGAALIPRQLPHASVGRTVLEVTPYARCIPSAPVPHVASSAAWYQNERVGPRASSRISMLTRRVLCYRERTLLANSPVGPPWRAMVGGPDNDSLSHFVSGSGSGSANCSSAFRSIAFATDATQSCHWAGSSDIRGASSCIQDNKKNIDSGFRVSRS